ncbi:hypothetical protein D3C78_655340 [compost metagenome]
MQQQALAEVARADAGRFELLNTVQHGLDFIQLDVELGVEGITDFFQGFVEVALVIDAVDQRHGDQPVGVGHRSQVQLPEQMALQALANGGAGGEVPLVIVVAGQAAGAGLVDVFPGGVDRQLVGDAFVPLAFFEVVHRRGGLLEAGFLNFGDGFALGVVGHRVAVVEVVAIFLALEHRV